MSLPFLSLCLCNSYLQVLICVLESSCPCSTDEEADVHRPVVTEGACILPGSSFYPVPPLGHVHVGLLPNSALFSLLTSLLCRGHRMGPLHVTVKELPEK